MLPLKRLLLGKSTIDGELSKYILACPKRCTERYFHWQTVRSQAKQQPKHLNDNVQSVQSYEPVIGLEVHAQIQSASKLFSSAPTDYVSRPNCQVAPFDLSLPGTLPVLNGVCVETAIRTALCLDCTISRRSLFDRKHYFYGDMPNGYQITQQREPIARDGWIDFIVYDEYYDSINLRSGLTRDKWPHQPYTKRCRLKQIQLEQDSGKSLADTESNRNLIDLNRAGVALMEFVFEPELNSALEAISLVRELILRLRAIEACNCRMEQGALRVDANVSVRPTGSSVLGTRTEIKNLNSFRFLREAIEHEIERQSNLTRDGQPVVNETLGYDFRSKKTYVMRDKEIIQDYRFMPEPNLPPILLKDSAKDSEGSEDDIIDVATIRANVPTSALPQSILSKLSQPEYQLTIREIFFLLNDSQLRQLFLDIFDVSKRKNGQEIFAFIQQLITISSTSYDESWIMAIDVSNLKTLTSAQYLAELIDLLYDAEITIDTAFDIIKLYIQKDSRSPRAIVEQYNWWLFTDPVQIEAICRDVVKLTPKVAKKFAQTGVRKPKSMLIQKAQVALGNRANENDLWDVFDKILRSDRQKKRS